MRCPNCGDIVRAIETVDTEWCDNKYYDMVEGTCFKCGKNWTWTEVYTHDHDEDMQEIQVNDHL